MSRFKGTLPGGSGKVIGVASLGTSYDQPWTLVVACENAVYLVDPSDGETKPLIVTAEMEHAIVP